ncbi:MAG: hypothetical protein EXR98_09860 [Gemmataceae bacterium]|nr:hypothetical protein [Gemmataceae bacterium]
MTKIAILPISGDQGIVTYCAVANGKRSQGATAGAALDALTSQLTEEESGTMVIVQSRRPDRFFNAAQQDRLAELMERWRSCRDQGKSLPAEEQAELEALVDAELDASAARAADLADKLKR